MHLRRMLADVDDRLARETAVLLLGPRHAGKTTLAQTLAAGRNAVYLDLESSQDVAKLADPDLYLADHADHLVILDEIHRVPTLLPALGRAIDRARRTGRPGLFLLLGSASFDLLPKLGEALEGRVGTVDIRPFDVLEAGNTAPERDRLWLRGGFPASFLAASGSISLRWRLEFIRSCLEHDLPRFAPRIPAERLRRLWTMLAHHQGGLLNVAQFGRNLGVDTRTAGSDIDLLVNLLLVRRLPPWQTDVGKRLTKAPKAYVRDSGLVHALLAIGGKETLLSHPVVGASWEGFAIEQLLAAAPRGSSAYFYRTSGGAEIDLLLSLPGDRLWAIDMKRNLTPRPDRGFSSACADVKPERRFLVYAGEESVQLGDDILATPLRALARLLARA